MNAELWIPGMRTFGDSAGVAGTVAIVTQLH